MELFTCKCGVLTYSSVFKIFIAQTITLSNYVVAGILTSPSDYSFVCLCAHVGVARACEFECVRRVVLERELSFPLLSSCHPIFL